MIPKKSGGSVSVHTAIGSNVKRLGVTASVKKICLKCQNIRITTSSNYSKNLGKISSKILMPLLHIRTNSEAKCEADDEHTNHIFASSFVASFASPFVAFALKVVFQTRVKEDEWWFMLCVVECLYACENSSFAQKQRHINVCASGEARHKHKCVKVLPHLHANTNEAGWDEAYANICLDCYMRQNVVVCRASEWFSLKYRLQVDSVRSASDRTKAVFLSSVTHLHCYACLVSACLARIFVLMWMRL